MGYIENGSFKFHQRLFVRFDLPAKSKLPFLVGTVIYHRLHRRHRHSRRPSLSHTFVDCCVFVIIVIIYPMSISSLLSSVCRPLSGLMVVLFLLFVVHLSFSLLLSSSISLLLSLSSLPSSHPQLLIFA